MDDVTMDGMTIEDMLWCIKTDFIMLKNGTWKPDDDSIDASLKIVEQLENDLIIENMDNLYGYFIHYNSYTKEWNAVKREVSNQYLNGTLNKKDIVKDTNINKLIKKLSS